VGSTLALAHPLYYDRLVQLASTIKFVRQNQKVAKLKRSRAKLKIGALLPDHTSNHDGVRLLSELSTLSKIQMVHTSFYISRLL
jgi:hypothetical protein